MKTTRSRTKVSISFCCIQLYTKICETDFPRMRLSMDREGNIRPTSDKEVFEFCPFCGKVVRTTLILSNKKTKKIM